LVSQAVLPTCDLLLSDRPNKSNPLAGISLDQPLGIAAVPEGSPYGVEPGGQSRIRDGAPAPYRGDNIVLADDPLTIADEVFEEIKSLRFNSNQFAAVPQFAADYIQIEILELVSQAKSSKMRKSKPTVSKRKALLYAPRCAIGMLEGSPFYPRRALCRSIEPVVPSRSDLRVLGLVRRC
jgi:hypothetical protein